MAAPEDAFEAWAGALDRYALALREYVRIVDAAAQKIRPGTRQEYRAAEESAAAALARAREEGGGAAAEGAGGGAALAERAFALFAALERARDSLDAGAAAALAPALLEEASRLMSRTFAEETARAAGALRDARAQAAAEAQARGAALAARWAPGVAAGAPATVAAVYREAPTSVPGSLLYAGALSAWKARGDGGAALLLAEDAAAKALGLPPDTAAAVAAAVRARGGLHPLEAMGLTFGLRPLPGAAAAPGDAAVVVDASLPQAAWAVRYDLAPLVDAKAAAAFGPLASIFSGLNFNLIRRLRTIVETPIGDGAPAREGAPAGGIRVTGRPGGGLVRTTDRGRTFQALAPPGGAPAAEAYAAVGAGPRPRVGRLGELLEAAVEGAPAGTLRDPEAFLADYQARLPHQAPPFTLDELGPALARAFASEYDARPPATAEEFRRAVLGHRAGRDFYRSYLAGAVSAVSGRAVEKEQLRRDAGGAGGPAALFGGRAAAARGGRAEAMLSALVRLRDSALGVQKALTVAYDETGAALRARRLFADRELPDARRRQDALELHRRVVGAALDPAPRAGQKKGRAAKRAEAVEPRPSLKLYALAHGDTSRPA